MYEIEEDDVYICVGIIYNVFRDSNTIYNTRFWRKLDDFGKFNKTFELNVYYKSNISVCILQFYTFYLSKSIFLNKTYCHLFEVNCLNIFYSNEEIH